MSRTKLQITTHNSLIDNDSLKTPKLEWLGVSITQSNISETLCLYPSTLTLFFLQKL